MMTSLNIIRQRLNNLGLTDLSINDLVRRYRCHDDTWIADRGVIIGDLATMTDRHFKSIAEHTGTMAWNGPTPAMMVSHGQ